MGNNMGNTAMMEHRGDVKGKMVMSPAPSASLFIRHLYANSASNFTSKELSAEKEPPSHKFSGSLLDHSSRQKQDLTFSSLNSQACSENHQQNRLVQLPIGKHSESHNSLVEECSQPCDQFFSEEWVLEARGGGGSFMPTTENTRNNIPRIPKANVGTKTQVSDSQIRPTSSNAFSMALQDSHNEMTTHMFDHQRTQMTYTHTQQEVVLQESAKGKHKDINIQNDLRVLEGISQWTASSYSNKQSTKNTRNAGKPLSPHGKRYPDSSVQTLKPNNTDCDGLSPVFPKDKTCFEKSVNKGQCQQIFTTDDISNPCSASGTDSFPESHGFSIQTESEQCSLEDASGRFSQEYLIDGRVNETETTESLSAFSLTNVSESKLSLDGSCRLNESAKCKREPVESECKDTLTSGSSLPVNLPNTMHWEYDQENVSKDYSMRQTNPCYEINPSKNGEQPDTDVKMILLKNESTNRQISKTNSESLHISFQAPDGVFGSLTPPVSTNFSCQSLVSPHGQLFSHDTGQFDPQLESHGTQLSSFDSSKRKMLLMESQCVESTFDRSQTSALSWEIQPNEVKTFYTETSTGNDYRSPSMDAIKQSEVSFKEYVTEYSINYINKDLIFTDSMSSLRPTINTSKATVKSISPDAHVIFDRSKEDRFKSNSNIARQGLHQANEADEAKFTPSTENSTSVIIPSTANPATHTTQTSAVSAPQIISHSLSNIATPRHERINNGNTDGNANNAFNHCCYEGFPNNTKSPVCQGNNHYYPVNTPATLNHENDDGCVNGVGNYQVSSNDSSGSRGVMFNPVNINVAGNNCINGEGNLAITNTPLNHIHCINDYPFNTNDAKDNNGNDKYNSVKAPPPFNGSKSYGYPVNFNTARSSHIKGNGNPTEAATIPNQSNSTSYPVNINSASDHSCTQPALKGRLQSLPGVRCRQPGQWQPLLLWPPVEIKADDSNKPCSERSAKASVARENSPVVVGLLDKLCVADQPEKKCHFHAYLLVSHKDLNEFGRPFLKLLESWNLRICFPQRDLVLTGLKYNNMAKIVEQRCNGKVIVVVSKNYPESDECRFLTAFTRTLDPDARLRSIIPVYIDKNIVDLPVALAGISPIHYNQSCKQGWLEGKIKGAL